MTGKIWALLRFISKRRPQQRTRPRVGTSMGLVALPPRRVPSRRGRRVSDRTDFLQSQFELEIVLMYRLQISTSLSLKLVLVLQIISQNYFEFRGHPS